MDFDVDDFLARPLTARLATNGPTIRPVWFLWEQQAFWILTGSWSRLPEHVRADHRLVLVVDTCEIDTGRVRQVVARGPGELLPFDVARGRRKLVRYLGADESSWDDRFRRYLHDDPAGHGTSWLRIRPERLSTRDLSFDVTP